MGYKIKHKPKHKEIARQEAEKKRLEQEENLPETIEYHDDFVDAASKALEKTLSLRYWVIGAVVFTVAVAVGVSIYTGTVKSKIEHQSRQFSDAQADFFKPVAGVDPAVGTLKESFATKEEKYSIILKKLDSFISTQKDSKLSVVSHMYKGNALLELGKYEEALSAYRIFMDKTDNADLRDLVQLKVASILKQQKKLDDAEKLLVPLKNTTNLYLSSASLYTLGEIYELKNNTDKAKETFKKVVELFKENPALATPYKAKAELKLIN